MKEMVGGCCVCSDEQGWTENPLVYCDGQGCNVAVHQACYGIVHVPTGPWFCRKCESQERAARVKCELCPQREGALKRTDTGASWCHVVCALFIPEAWFANVQTMEPIVLKNLPPERFTKTCYICEEQGRASKANTGACMTCNRNGCKQSFHVTCAQSLGLLCEEKGNYGDNVKYCGYCTYHYKKLVRVKKYPASRTKKDNHIKQIPAFKPVSNESSTPESTPEKPANPSDSKNVKKSSKQEPKENGRPVSSTLTTVIPPASTENGKPGEKPPITPPSSNTSSGIGTSDSSAVSPTESTVSEEAIPEARNFPNSVLSDRNSLQRSNSSGSLTSSHGSISESKPLSENRLAVSVDGGSMCTLLGSTSSLNSATELTHTYSESVESFMAAKSGKRSTSGTFTVQTQSDTEIDSAAKRPRSRSQEKGEKKAKRSKPGVIATNRRLSRNVSIDGDDSPPPFPRKSKKKSDLTVNTNSINSATASGLGFSVFGGSPYFQSLSAPGPLSLSGFGQNAVSSSVLGSVSDGSLSQSNLCGPPKAFPSQQNVNKEQVNGEFPATLEQLLERQWEQGSQFLMKQGEHFDIASLLHCLHHLKTENQRLEEEIRTLTSRKDHLLAVNARLSIPLGSGINHVNSSFTADKPKDSSSTSVQSLPSSALNSAAKSNTLPSSTSLHPASAGASPTVNTGTLQNQSLISLANIASSVASPPFSSSNLPFSTSGATYLPVSTVQYLQTDVNAAKTNSKNTSQNHDT